MIFGDVYIRQAIENGDINVDPYEPDNVQPASIDLRLGTEFTRIKPADDIIDTRDADSITETQVSNNSILLDPNDTILGTTKEYISIPNTLVGKVVGRSSLGRLNIVIHKTAGYVDPGFEGEITLEIENQGSHPVRLYAGDRVCQMWFAETYPVETAYDEKKDSQYSGQTGATTPTKNFFENS